jgi:nitrogen regulatory protein PII
MKRVVAIIQPFKLEEVEDAVRQVGVSGINVAEVMGFGHQKGHTEIHSGTAVIIGRGGFGPARCTALVLQEMATLPKLVKSRARSRAKRGASWIFPRVPIATSPAAFCAAMSCPSLRSARICHSAG